MQEGEALRIGDDLGGIEAALEGKRIGLGEGLRAVLATWVDAGGLLT